MLSANQRNYLEDIKNKSLPYEFFLDKYLGSYHIPSIIDADLRALEVLMERSHLVKLSKQETIVALNNAEPTYTTSNFNLKQFENNLETELNQENVDWGKILQLISEALTNTIASDNYEAVVRSINKVNDAFQLNLAANYPQLKNSSAVKSPKIVSKILEYIDFNYRDDKVALIVVDGLSWWQYDLFRKKIAGSKKESHVYSWLPSITQLSRQAIFKGDAPLRSYRQNPTNEAKLWLNYWKAKGLNDFEIRYNHEKIDLNNLSPLKRFALVFKDLDDYMHSSKDFTDLLKLTENWIVRSKIIEVIDQLLKANFKVFITSDHGNIHAKGWRSLKGREKLGTNKSGSRSERHIEYSEQWLKEDLLSNNPDLNDSVVQEEQAIYFKNNYSFSSKESLVTHGGSHILEVLVPFIEISNDK